MANLWGCDQIARVGGGAKAALARAECVPVVPGMPNSLTMQSNAHVQINDFSVGAHKACL